MDSIHDLGGRQGFGRVEPEADEPVFHDRWEAAIFTMTATARRAGAVQNTDQFRHAVERIDPIAYLTHGYYGRWLGALETLFVEAGTITSAELDQKVVDAGGDRRAPVAARPDPEAFAPFPVDPDAPADGSAHRELPSAPRFAVGQLVRTAAQPHTHHTRLPAYARNRVGTIHGYAGAWVFPDTNAHGLGERPQHLYSVMFSGDTLWGDETEPGVCVYLDLFEPYLEACDG